MAFPPLPPFPASAGIRAGLAPGDFRYAGLTGPDGPDPLAGGGGGGVCDLLVDALFLRQLVGEPIPRGRGYDGLVGPELP